MANKRWLPLLLIGGIFVACDSSGTDELPDLGTRDGGVRDGGADAGRPDLGPVDTGLRDLGFRDAATDSGVEDAAEADASLPVDLGVDAGPVDVGSIDAGSIDAGSITLTLQNASATFSQTEAGAFSVMTAFNGLQDGLGWAIHPNEGYQAAVVETSSDTPAYASGTRITFRLDQTFPVEHAIGRFRLSYTTVDRDQFADGNDGSSTPGNVGEESDWTVLIPLTAVDSNGATMTVQSDQSILAQDLNSVDSVYTVVAEIAGGAITGFRIEVLEDPSLPLDGPGMQDTNGNFVLSEMSVEIEPR